MIGQAQTPGAVSAAAMPGTRALGVPDQLACPAGYHCRALRRYVCMQKGLYNPVLSRAPRTPCTAYAATMAFRFAANGKYVQIVPHSLHCRVHDPHVLIRLHCYVERGRRKPSEFASVTARFEGLETSMRARDPRFPYDYRYFVLFFVSPKAKTLVQLLT